MEREHFEDFLKKYRKEKDHAQGRARHHQRIARRLEWGLILCSSVTTLLVPFSALLKSIAIISINTLLSAVVTTIATVMRSLKAQEKAAFYQTLYRDLDDEYYRYTAQLDSYQKFSDKESLFVQRVIAILDEANKKMPQSTILSTNTEDGVDRNQREKEVGIE